MRVGIFAWHDVSAAYSCLFYLKDALNEYMETELWTHTETESIPIEYRKGYHSFKDTWYGRIRKFRVYAAKIHTVFLAKKYDIIIINDLDFFWSGFIAKKLNNKLKIIHYNTEIPGVDVPCPRHTRVFYEKHADYPDMIIECLNERAKFRKEKYGISQKIYCINNTLPKSVVDEISDKDIEVTDYLSFREPDLPVLIYAGGCDLSRNLGDLISASSAFLHKANFLLFCHGSDENFSKVKEACEGNDNCYLYPAVDRTILLKVMESCQIGVQYYDPMKSVNFMYAAPSKFFEYMSMGLNVISTKNLGIDKIIYDNKLGICIEENEKIEEALMRLLNNGLTRKESIKEVFNKRYCYEIDSKETVNAIVSLAYDKGDYYK